MGGSEANLINQFHPPQRVNEVLLDMITLRPIEDTQDGYESYKTKFRELLVQQNETNRGLEKYILPLSSWHV